MVGVGHQGRERLGYSEAVERPHGRLVEAHEHPIVQHGLFECGVHDVPSAHQSPQRRGRAARARFGGIITNRRGGVGGCDCVCSIRIIVRSRAFGGCCFCHSRLCPSAAFVG